MLAHLLANYTEESFKLGLRLGLHLRLGLGQVGWHFIRQKCITECELIRAAIRVAQRQWVTVESAGEWAWQARISRLFFDRKTQLSYLSGQREKERGREGETESRPNSRHMNAVETDTVVHLLWPQMAAGVARLRGNTRRPFY